MRPLKTLKATSVAAATMFTLACATHAGNYYAFNTNDPSLSGDFVFGAGDTIEIFTDHVSIDPLFTGNVTINGGTLIVTATNGFDPSAYDDNSTFQVFTPGQYAGDFDEVTIFGQQAYQTTGSSMQMTDWSLDDFDSARLIIIGDLSFANVVNSDGGQLILYYAEVNGEWVLFDPNPVPEPSTYALLLAAGIGAIALLRRHRNRKRQ